MASLQFRVLKLSPCGCLGSTNSVDPLSAWNCPSRKCCRICTLRACVTVP